MLRGRWDGSVRRSACARASMLRAVAILGAGAVLAGCGAYADGIGTEAQSDELELGSVEQAMEGGSPVVGDTSYPAVARLEIIRAEGTFLCSSFRLGNRRSLTAAHCFDKIPGVAGSVPLFDGEGSNPNPISVRL